MPRLFSVPLDGLQAPAAPAVGALRYFHPTLLALEPASTGTDGGDSITLRGANLGDGTLRSLGTLVVHFHDSVCTAVASDCPPSTNCDCAVLSHNHSALVVRVPPGIGVRRK